MSYHVLYEVYGVVDWDPYPDEKAFQQYYAGFSDEYKELYHVLQAGDESLLTIEHCQEMKRRTPLVCRIGKAVATGDEGELARLQEQHPGSFVKKG